MSVFRSVTVALAVGAVHVNCGGFPNAEQAQIWRNRFVKKEPVVLTEADKIKDKIAYCEKQIVQGLVVNGYESISCLSSDEVNWNPVEKAVIQHFVNMGYVFHESYSYDDGYEYYGNFSLPKK